MLKVKNGIATREPIPQFLHALAPESLADLSWTDPQLGVRGAAWWPEENGDGELPVGHKWGAETLTVDPERRVVTVTHEAVPLSADELSELLQGARAPVIRTNNEAYEAAMCLLTDGYPRSEIDTWELQRAEALAWQANPDTATPWVDLAADARGLPRDEFMARTLAKVHAFTAASACLTGRRQGIEDAIRNAKSVSELERIVFDYTLPAGVLPNAV